MADNKNKAWYAIHTYSGYEKKVQTTLLTRAKTMNMEDYILRCIVPEEKVAEMKNGANRTVVRKLFPGYVFVEMVLTDESWYVVRNTTGVTGFVGAGNSPVPLQEYEVEPLLRAMKAAEDGEAAPPADLDAEVGDTVGFTDAAFAGFIGTVTAIDQDRRKVQVSAALFGGRETQMEMDFDKVYVKK